MNLRNKTAIVTGAGRGIGKGITLALAKEGCNIVAGARSRDSLNALKSEVEAAGTQCVAIPVDLRSMDAVATLLSAAEKAFGSLDILINNAGVIYSDGISGVTEAQWDETMDVNLKAQFFLAQGALERMKANAEGGYIINISSTVALGAKPGVTSYSVSKYGVMGMSEALYQEAKLHGVKVSTIYPGVTDTEMLRGQDMPCGPNQWMLPEDIADCAMFLLRTSSRMVIRDIVPWSTGYDQI